MDNYFDFTAAVGVRALSLRGIALYLHYAVWLIANYGDDSGLRWIQQHCPADLI
jgi:hypothetical protein